MTEPTDPVIRLMDTARALRALAQGLNGRKDDDGDLPAAGVHGLAFLLALLADNVDSCVERLDNT